MRRSAPRPRSSRPCWSCPDSGGAAATTCPRPGEAKIDVDTPQLRALKADAGIEDCVPGHRRAGRRRPPRPHAALPRRRPGRRPRHPAGPDGRQPVGVLVRPVPQGDAGAPGVPREVRRPGAGPRHRLPGPAAGGRARAREEVRGHLPAARRPRRRPQRQATRSRLDPRLPVPRCSSTPTARSTVVARRGRVRRRARRPGRRAPRDRPVTAPDLPDWLRPVEQAAREIEAADLTRFVPAAGRRRPPRRRADALRRGRRRAASCCSPSAPTTCARTPARSRSPAGRWTRGRTWSRLRCVRRRRRSGSTPSSVTVFGRLPELWLPPSNFAVTPSSAGGASPRRSPW